MELFDILFGDSRLKTCEGYTINYSEPYWDPCPYYGCITYQIVEESTLCYCPKYVRLLVHYN